MKRTISLSVLAVAAVGILIWLLTGFGQARTARTRSDSAHHYDEAPYDLEATSETARRASGDEDAEEAATRSCTIEVIGRDGKPLPRLYLWIHHFGGPPGEGVRTDAEGRATVSYPSTAEDSFVSGPPLFSYVPLRPPLTRVRLEDRLPLRIEVVDATTGQPVDGAAVELVQNWKERYALTPKNGAFELATSPATSGSWMDTMDLRVRPPRGYSGPARVLVGGQVSALARELRMTVPLVPERSLAVRVEGRDGKPADARIEGLYSRFNSKVMELDCTIERTGTGRFRIGSVPCVVSFKVSARSLKDNLCGSTLVRWTGRSKEIVVRLDTRGLYAELAPDVEEEEEEVEEIDGVPPASWSGDCEVRVLLHDGTPAGGVEVWAYAEDQSIEGLPRASRTDGHGWTRFGRLPRTTISLKVEDPGILPLGIRVDLGETPHVRMDLREPRPRRVRILIRSKDGSPRPCVQVMKEFFATVRDGVQVCGVFTDRDGEAIIETIPPEGVRIHVFEGALSKHQWIGEGTGPFDLQITLD